MSNEKIAEVVIQNKQGQLLTLLVEKTQTRPQMLIMPAFVVDPDEDLAQQCTDYCEDTLGITMLLMKEFGEFCYEETKTDVLFIDLALYNGEPKLPTRNVSEDCIAYAGLRWLDIGDVPADVFAVPSIQAVMELLKPTEVSGTVH